MAVRVNAVGTDIVHAHEVTERGPHGDFTVRYLDGPKRGLQIHFFSRSELAELSAEEQAAVLRHAGLFLERFGYSDFLQT